MGIYRVRGASRCRLRRRWQAPR